MGSRAAGLSVLLWTIVTYRPSEILQPLRKSKGPRTRKIANFLDTFFDHLYCIQHYSMPRPPLQEISPNIRRGKELTPYTRSKIATLQEEEAEIDLITECVKIS
jgi:hypothetical protein